MRAFFEPRFGADFSAVRVHRNSAAAETAQQINAKAFTYGNHIVFGTGQHRPETDEGRKLIAHELAHVVQQSAGRVRSIQRGPLFLYDSTDNPLRRWGYAKEYCDDYRVLTGYCAKDKSGTLHAGVDSLSGAIGWISHFKSRGKTIDKVFFLTHGAPGYVHLPRGGLSTSNASALKTVSSDLSAHAIVGFLGCNVAEGPKGDAFLVAAGSAMLGKGGGKVFASDSVTFSVPGLGQRGPLWSTIKVVCIDPGGVSKAC